MERSFRDAGDIRAPRWLVCLALRHRPFFCHLRYPLGNTPVRGWGVDCSPDGLSLKKILNYSHRSSIKAASEVHSWCRGLAVPKPGGRGRVLCGAALRPRCMQSPLQRAAARTEGLSGARSASRLRDQPWLMGPPHPALLPSRPRKPMPSPGAGRTVQGGLTAQSRLSAAPRGLLTGTV